MKKKMKIAQMIENAIFTGSPEGADMFSNDSKAKAKCGGGDWVEAEAESEAVECYNYY